MELLIVHRDPEMGPALVQMMTKYTSHHCDLVGSDVAALEWGRRNQKCDLLLTQVAADGIHGLTLGSSLSEIFPALQVLFFPAYPSSDQRLEIAETKIFPEPIEGDALLGAIERAEKVHPDEPDLFHIVDVVQMCCLSRFSGAIQLVRGDKSGLIYLRAGQIVHAETTAIRGQHALFEIVSWEYVEFAYERSVRAPLESVTLPWDELLIEAIDQQKETLGSRRRSA